MFIKAVEEDKALIFPVILDFFENNPNIAFTIKKKKNINKALTHFAEYVWRYGIALDALYRSEDNKTFAIVYSSAKKLPFWQSVYLNWYMARHVLAFTHIPAVLRRQSRLQKIRKQNTGYGEYLYFFALGVAKGYRGFFPKEQAGSGILQMKRFIKELQRKTGLPVLAETVNPRTKRLYETVNFRAYKTDVDENGLQTFFLIRDPNAID